MCGRQIVIAACLAAAGLPSTGRADDQPAWVVYQGQSGAGSGRRIVFVTGDDEYRSEEGMPQLARILAVRHGFTCTVLFAVNPQDGTIKPDQQDNIPGLEALHDADLMVIFTRFRNLPPEQMRHIVDYVESGRPIVALRTSTHAFNLPGDHPYARYTWNSTEWDGGFGRQVLGETWINHHGQHGKQSTRGILAPDAAGHPILRGLADGDIWGPTDVYGVRLPLEGCQPLVLGQVLQGMQPDDPPVEGPQNDPMMPIAWVKTWSAAPGKQARVFVTTMGASQDLQSEGLRRLLVNACYWALGMEDVIPERADVSLVGEYHPTPFGFGTYQKGIKPADLALP